MSYRLVKIAKELNVGTSTIVEFLAKTGNVIENKPTVKVSEDLYELLLKEFSNSMDIKEKANSIVIGTRKEEPAPVVTPKPIFSIPVVPPAPVAPVVEPAKEQAVVPPTAPEPIVEVKTEPVTPAEEKGPAPAKEVLMEDAVPDNEEIKADKSKAELPKLKVIGKIDLNPKKPEPKIEKPATESLKVEEQPKTVVTPKQEADPVSDNKSSSTPSSEPKVVKKPAAESAPSDTVKLGPDGLPATMERAKAPMLKGLKIMGKIDAGKLDQINKTPSKDKAKSADDDANKRKKRKRKKVAPAGNTSSSGDSNTSSAPPRQGNGGGVGRPIRNNGGGGVGRPTSTSRRDEVKEVSKKEIEEKIKATMARITGGGKNKRQKIRRDSREEKRERQEVKDQEEESGVLRLTEFVSVSELASLLNVPVTEVIMTCMNLGVIVSINQRLDAEIIELVSSEFDTEVEFISAEAIEDQEEEIEEDPALLEPRSPIVTVMGHVDHGKTSLLDYIRDANVADGEAGGITQHIGAYEVRVGDDRKKITFLDTPGHEAFTAMRARGAKVTDIVIIIVAADDQIMPQTKEAISHAQAAGVPMVFAINKIDKDGAQPERIKQQLAEMNLLLEDWGGTYQSQEISAKTGENIELLLEKVALQAEMLELTANPNKQALGAVLEASLDKGRGYVTKLLVQSGTLKIGDSVVAGEHSGKVKAMFNEKGQRVKKAGPSAPVLLLGLSGAPQAGEKFKVVDSEQESRQLAAKRAQISREQTNRASKRISLDEIGRRLSLGTFKELNLIIKGDVDGSVEALADSLIKMSIETVQVNVLHKAVGQIVESDILLASASDAIVIGFQVRPSSNARQLAEKEGVQIKTYSIIYEAIDELKLAIEGMLEPTKEEKIIAQVRVREIYKISKIGTIAGCFVEEGKITRNTLIRVIRDGIVVFPIKEGAVGELSSLKRFKDDVKEVKFGFECGITIKGFNDIKDDDVIEGYEIVEVKQKLK